MSLLGKQGGGRFVVLVEVRVKHSCMIVVRLLPSRRHRDPRLELRLFERFRSSGLQRFFLWRFSVLSGWNAQVAERSRGSL